MHAKSFLLNVIFLLLSEVPYIKPYDFIVGNEYHYSYIAKSKFFGKTEVDTNVRYSINPIRKEVNGDLICELHVNNFLMKAGVQEQNIPDKWDFKKSFQFILSNDGLIEDVLHTHNENDQVLTLKKALASVLSAKSRHALKRKENFHNLERDHAGHLAHEYKIETTSSGFRVHKYHESENQIYRQHSKTLEYSHTGLIHSVKANDKVILRDKSKSQTETVRTKIEGEGEIKEETSGELKDIELNTTTEVRLESIRKSTIKHEETYHILEKIKDSIVVQKSPQEKRELQELQTWIDKNVTCVQNNTNEVHKNRMDCFANLLKLIDGLKTTDYNELVQKELTTACHTNDTDCRSRRTVFIDLFLRKGDNLTQSVIISHFLENNQSFDTDLQRIFHHVVGLVNPTLEFFEAIEDICLGKDHSKIGSKLITKYHKRSCLALGTLIKGLRKNTRATDKIQSVIHSLQRWTMQHNQTQYQELFSRRSKRTVDGFDSELHHHTFSKAVLLHSIGNTGTSLELLMSYMNPGEGDNVWRRAAIHGLRHFTCQKSATALLHLALDDNHSIVRQHAYEMYKNHPVAKRNVDEHKNIILERSYTYKTLMRIKRGILQLGLEDGFFFSLKIPSVQWSKTLGNSALGAEIGLVITNSIEVELKPLSGHAMLNIYDEAYAKAMMGLFSLEVYFFRAMVCFRGHAGYDMNILKDFGINRIEDLVHIFDKIVATLVTPIKEAINAFKHVVQLFEKGIEYIVNRIIDIIKKLPLILKSVVQKVVDTVLQVLEFSGEPWIQHAKKIIIKTRYFIEDIVEDITEFYNTVADAITITLPYVAKKLYDAVASVISAVNNFLTNPLQSLKMTGKSVLDIKLAIKMFLEVKNKVMEALSFLKGGIPFWMSYWEDFKEIVEDVKELFNLMTLKEETSKSTEFEDELSIALSDGIRMTKEQTDIMISIMKRAFSDFISLFESTTGNLSEPFFSAFITVVNAVKNIKSSYEKVRDVFMTAKTLVQKVFGSKFHLSFPKRRRSNSPGCGNGIWPTKTNGLYGTTGVDVRAPYSSVIPCPVNGEVFKESEDRVKIKPSETDFTEYEIIIENITPDSNITIGGIYKIAGSDRLGKAKKSKCQPNFIHLAVRKRTDKKRADSDYKYVDPSPFLDRLLPIPQWIWDCKDYLYTHMGQTVEADATKEGLDQRKHTISRKPTKGSGEISNMFPEVEPKYRPYDLNLVKHKDLSAKRIWESFKNGLKNALASFKDIGKQLFDFSHNRTGKNILDVVNINEYTLKEVKDVLGNQYTSEIDAVYNKLHELQSSITAQNLEGLSMSKLQQLLPVFTYTETKDKSAVISRILSKTEEDCPSFSNRLSKGHGHVCFAHPDCMGLSCAILLSNGLIQNMVSVDIKIDSCLGTLSVTPKNMPSTTLNFRKGDMVIIEEEVILGNIPNTLFTGILTIDIVVDSSKPIITITSKVCVPDYVSCVQHVPILESYEVPQAICSPGNSKNTHSLSMEKVTIEEFIATLSDNHLLDQQILKVLDTLREAIMSQLLDDPRTLLKILGQEFPDKVDFCMDALIPFPTTDFVFVDSKRLPPVFIMVGPVPIFFEFGAAASLGIQIHVGLCILSCTAAGEVTPWVGAKVWGGAFIQFFVIKAGIRITGYLLETRFPVRAEITYNEFPLVVTGQLDMSLVPLRLKLEAYCHFEISVGFFTFTITIFRGTIFSITTTPITANIFKIPKELRDLTPPKFGLTSVSGGNDSIKEKRETMNVCDLRQLAGRHHKDPAFELQISVTEDMENIKVYYAIGTQHGGTNVNNFTYMGGPSILQVTSNLPHGVPLHWTVKAINSQGLEARVYCMLPSYDNTLPDGRVDHSYKYSSHPNALSATVSAFDDSKLKEHPQKALGYVSGQFGTQISSWQKFSLDSSAHRSDITSDLKYFSFPKRGKLTTTPISIHIKQIPEDCASECLKYESKCISFDWDYLTESCELQQVVEGPNARLRNSRTYQNYERLGIGYNAFIRYNDIDLKHGFVYYINARVENVLGYIGYLHSTGTMVDFTPPEPGPLGDDFVEFYSKDLCNASVAQRCHEVTTKFNHRHVIDGKSSSTVFNGHTPLVDKLFTRSNNYISVNFDGFHDDESGIYMYLWAVGNAVCQTDVIDFQDPHQFLHSSKHWTHSGFQKNIHLNDGQYFVTVQVLNNVVFGGSLVSTVCHSIPLTVDTTPPIFNSVDKVYFDEYFDILGVYYQAGDNESSLSGVYFGLGKTKYDVLVRKYHSHEPMNEKSDPYIAIEKLDLEAGLPAWIRIRVENMVGLFAAGSGMEPILVDRTKPVAGLVYDGSMIHHDISFQSENSEICAMWTNFYDRESGVDQLGVGTVAGEDNVVNFENFTHNTRHACVSVSLQHNVTYYSTVIVVNGALNSKDANSTSDGVTIDITPPESGFAVDGADIEKDISFSSASATKACIWANVTDPESGIEKYSVSVYANDHFQQEFSTGKVTSFVDHSIKLNHMDKIHFEILAVNHAGLTVNTKTNGYIIDQTPPVMSLIQDATLGGRFQTSTSTLNLEWEFIDVESGIKEYRYFVYEFLHGMKNRFWPISNMFESISPSRYLDTMKVDLKNLYLVPGATYSVHVTAVNHASLSTSHESDGVIIDPTPPVMVKVHVGLLEDEEEVDNQGYVKHANSENIRMSWEADDPESAVTKFYLAVGIYKGDTSLTTGYLDMGTEESSDIRVSLTTYSESGKLYYVSVIAQNGAGMSSAPMYSKPILVIKENIPGLITDGRRQDIDENFSSDKYSVGMFFHGFSSEACNIVKYEWAIGSNQYYTDVMGYTSYGIVHNDTHGKAQTHVELQENTKYFVSVRAKTGHNCHEEYIVSSSDGFVVDNTSPTISNIVPIDLESHFVDTKSKCIYQYKADSFEYMWNVTDNFEIKTENVSIRSPLQGSDIYPSTIVIWSRLPPALFKPDPGTPYFVKVYTEDVVGLWNHKTSLSIVADISAPLISSFSCTDTISMASSLITCNWIIKENESKLKKITISIGSKAFTDDIFANTTLQPYQSVWSTSVHRYLRFDNISSVFINIRALNTLNQASTDVREINIDRSPPEIENVVFITWTDPKNDLTNQICQLPWSFVDVNFTNVEDTESGVERAEMCIGTEAGKDDIKPYLTVDWRTYVTIDNIFAPPGTLLYATVRVFNKVGLHSTLTSEPIIVSPDPVLEVIDGPGSEDADYQSDLNVIRGSYRYSDRCPITKVEWSVEDLSGKLIQDYVEIPGNSFVFYNDELSLKNNFLYFINVKITDALNRTREGHSNGVSVLIQPPEVGLVRDGLGTEDINYQESVTELSGNWDAFGDKSSRIPTQLIEHYEVSIGDDTRNHITRTNIHYFFNVDLNTSYTFTGLNLTAKSVRYYITVRAYSVTGVFQENYSNGVRVGYRDGVIPGEIESTAAQSSTNEISVSWNDFESDIGIVSYTLAVSTSPVINTNKSFKCDEIKNSSSKFDIQSLTNIGINTYQKVTNLSLIHRGKYFVTVIGRDEIGTCAASTSHSIIVDLTPPDINEISFIINSWNISGRKRIYVTDAYTMDIEILNLTDSESNIRDVLFTLYRYPQCPSKIHLHSSEEIVAEIKAVGNSKVTMSQLSLQADTNYYIRVIATNNAGLQNSFHSPVISFDSSPPMKGDAKIGFDWTEESSFQSSKTSIHAWTAIARSNDAYECSNVKTIYPPFRGWSEQCKVSSGYFNPSFVNFHNNKLILKIGYNVQLTKVLRSGVSCAAEVIKEGIYSASFSAAFGNKTLTSFAVSSSERKPLLPTEFTRPTPDNFDEVQFNTSGDQVSYTANTRFTTQPVYTMTTRDRIGEASNQSYSSYHRLSNFISEGFGFHIFGDKQEKSKSWDCLFWANDKNKEVHRWVEINENPFENSFQYSIKTQKVKAEKGSVWNLEFLVNKDLKARIYGLSFLEDKINAFLRVWNLPEYEEPLLDPFRPYRSQAVVSNIKIPAGNVKSCIHGRGFYDAESGISEIWVGISDNPEHLGNIAELKLYRSLCVHCSNNCSFNCDLNCSEKNGSLIEFEEIPILISGLNLKNTVTSGNGLNASEKTELLNITNYYLNVKVMNFAGQSVYSVSNPVIVDTSPPLCDYIRCTDPINSGLDSPVTSLGSNKTIGAYWSCEDNISGIKATYIRIGNENSQHGNNEDENILKEKYVGNVDKIRVDLEDGTVFKDRTNYYVNIRVENAAGLSSFYSCYVKTILSPPDVSQVVTKVEFVTKIDNDTGITFAESSRKIGVQWHNEMNDTEYYRWQIGTYFGGSDVVPDMIISGSNEGSVEIIDGEMWMNGNRTGKSVAAMTSDTWSNKSEAAAVKSRENFKFLMEPGRCVFISVFAVGYSGLRNAILTQTLCLSRSDDAIFKSENVHISNVVCKDSKCVSGDPNSENGEVVFSIKGSVTAAVIGLLSKNDLTESYGSAASLKFKSYLEDPQQTTWTSTREIRNRIVCSLGTSFFITPTPYMELEEMTVQIKINPNDFDNSTVPALLVWDAYSFNTETGEFGIWKHVAESCNEDITKPNITGNVYTVKVCPRTFTDVSKKRSTTVSLTSPYQMTLSSMNVSFYNSAPEIDTAVIETYEDVDLTNFQLRFKDNEMDDVIFKLEVGPKLGKPSLSMSGLLNYTCPPDFFGEEYILVSATDNSRFPATVNKNITIKIKALNDLPQFGINYNGTFFDVSNYKNITLFFEGNETKHSLFDFTFADVDANESFTFLESFTNTVDVKINVTEKQKVTLIEKVFTNYNIRTCKEYTAELTINKSFYGHFQYYLLGRDSQMFYTERLEVNVYILLSPCVNGQCSRRDGNSPKCQHVTRASTFGPYICECSPGYVGTWCEKEVNECLQKPCGLLYDCTDKINGYECTMIYRYLIGLLIGCVLCIVLLVRFGRYLKNYTKRYRQTSPSQPSPDDEKDIDDGDDFHSLNTGDANNLDDVMLNIGRMQSKVDSKKQVFLSEMIFRKPVSSEHCFINDDKKDNSNSVSLESVALTRISSNTQHETIEQRGEESAL